MQLIFVSLGLQDYQISREFESTMANRAADIVFLLDITGSMQPCIDALQRNIATFIDFLSADDANNEMPVKDWRGKVVGYRDVKYDGDDWYEDNDFVRDADALKSQIAAMKAKGGGEEPDSLLDAIYRVGALEAVRRGLQEDDPRRWRHQRDAARVVVIFTDASYHPTMSLPEAIGGTLEDVGILCSNNKLLLAIFAPEMPCYDDLAAIKKSEYECTWEDGEDPIGSLNSYYATDGPGSACFDSLLAYISEIIAPKS